jgi:hypothetical protein
MTHASSPTWAIVAPGRDALRRKCGEERDNACFPTATPSFPGFRPVRPSPLATLSRTINANKLPLLSMMQDNTSYSFSFSLGKLTQPSTL